MTVTVRKGAFTNKFGNRQQKSEIIRVERTKIYTCDEKNLSLKKALPLDTHVERNK